MATNPVNSVIRRLQLSVATDGLTVTVGPGICYTPDTTNRLISDGSQSVTLVSPTVSTWYHAYAYQGSDGTLAMEVVTTAPSAVYQGTARTKTGDTSRRYLGSMYVQSTGKIRPFRHTIAGEVGNRILFDASSTAGSIPNPILSILTATTVQTLSLNPLLPITAKEAICQVANLSNRYAYISRPGLADPSVTNFQVMAGPAACPVADIMLNDSQQMTVVLSATGILGAILAVLSGSLTIYSLGYTFDRQADRHRRAYRIMRLRLPARSPVERHAVRHGADDPQTLKLSRAGHPRRTTMANPEDIITDDLTKNEDGQYVNKAGEIVAVDSIAYRNERLEARKIDAIDDQLGKDKSTSVEDPDAKRDNEGRKPVAKKAAKAKAADKKDEAKAESASSSSAS